MLLLPVFGMFLKLLSFIIFPARLVSIYRLFSLKQKITIILGQQMPVRGTMILWDHGCGKAGINHLFPV